MNSVRARAEGGRILATGTTELLLDCFAKLSLAEPAEGFEVGALPHLVERLRRLQQIGFDLRIHLLDRRARDLGASAYDEPAYEALIWRMRDQGSIEMDRAQLLY